MKKLLKRILRLFLKVEFLLNKILELVLKIYNIVFAFFYKFLPEKTKGQLTDSKEKINKKRQQAKDNINNLTKTLFEKYIKNIGLRCKEAIIWILATLKGIDFKKLSFFKIVGTVSQFLLQVISKLLDKFSKWFLSLSPKGTLIFLFVLMVIGLSLLKIFVSGEKIYYGSGMGKRESGKVKVDFEKLGRRPAYYKMHKKYIKLEKVYIPIYVQGSTGLKNIVLDFSIQSSNRYIVNFFKEYEHIIRDHFTKVVEPTVPSFPLTDEGKRILRQKIVTEVQKLIKKYKIRGEIKDVYFTNVMAI